MTLSHSYSSIKMFDNCPKRYYHQRVTKEVIDHGGEASKHGERVHKSLEDRLGPQRVPLPPEMSRHEKVCQTIERVATGAKLFLEKELVITEDLKPTHWRDGDAWMRSKLDVMGLNGCRGLCVDWKTGKRRPDFLQLEISAVQMFIHYPELDIVTTAFVWLKDEKLDMEVYTRGEFEDLLTMIKAKAQRIEAAKELDVWPAKPGPLCNYCPAKGICSFASDGRRRY